MSECIITPNGAGELIWFDGTRLHPLSCADELEAVDMVYRAANPGAERCPRVELGSPDAPWATRFVNAAQRELPRWEQM